MICRSRTTPDHDDRRDIFQCARHIAHAGRARRETRQVACPDEFTAFLPVATLIPPEPGELAVFENREGKRVPNVTFRTRQDSDWVDLTSDEVFTGKTVVVFSLPGAFTPTCSSSHVPRFNKL